MRYLEEIEQGVLLLNKRVIGWRERIDLDRLDMWVGDSCVLGQLFGDYFVGEEVLGIESEGVHYGFILEQYETENYSELTKEWKIVLSGKR